MASREGIAQDARTHVWRLEGYGIKCIAHGRTEKYIVDGFIGSPWSGKEQPAICYGMNPVPGRERRGREGRERNNAFKPGSTFLNAQVRTRIVDDDVASAGGSQLCCCDPTTQQKRNDGVVANDAPVVAGHRLNVALERNVGRRIKKERERFIIWPRGGRAERGHGATGLLVLTPTSTRCRHNRSRSLT